MKQTKLIMGMPITLEILDQNTSQYFKQLFDYFHKIDRRFSSYKSSSEISQINRGLGISQSSKQMKQVLALCEQTRQETNGYFNINHNDKLDPSGLVKGWAINEAAKQLDKAGLKQFYIEAGGDIEVRGADSKDQIWQIGIRNPFNLSEIVKTIKLTNQGVATSGLYIRGPHIYNPKQPGQELSQVKSLTVVGPNVYEADRFATAAFAMGQDGINFIEAKPGLEGYMINNQGIATMSSGFERYTFA